jgi:K+ transporter
MWVKPQHNAAVTIRIMAIKPKYPDFCWRWPVGPALTASGLFLAVDFAFFAANLFKIREGGWIPLTRRFWFSR